MQTYINKNNFRTELTIYITCDHRPIEFELAVFKLKSHTTADN